MNINFSKRELAKKTFSEREHCLSAGMTCFVLAFIGRFFVVFLFLLVQVINNYSSSLNGLCVNCP